MLTVSLCEGNLLHLLHPFHIGAEEIADHALAKKWLFTNLSGILQLMKTKTRLQQAYSNYRQSKKTKSSLLDWFALTMPELIFRTSKLEGEPVTRKMVRALFK